MFTAYRDRALDGIAAVKAHLAVSERLRAQFGHVGASCPGAAVCAGAEIVAGAPDDLQWRIIDQSAAVSRLYALYENYVHELVRAYLAFIEEAVPFDELSKDFKKAYRLGMAQVIQRIDRSRFSSVVLVDLMRSYADAITESGPYKLEPLAFLNHDRNLTLEILSGLLSAIGIDNVTQWVGSHDLTVDFFAGNQRLRATAADELSSFISDRNDAAHKSLSVSDLIGVDLLNEYADFASTLISVIADLFNKSALMIGTKAKLSREHGRVTELFASKTILVGPMTGSFLTGGALYLCGKHRCQKVEALSLQLDDEDIEGISLLSETELGIRISSFGRKGDIVMSFTPTPLVAAPELVAGNEAASEEDYEPQPTEDEEDELQESDDPSEDEEFALDDEPAAGDQV